jgi:hypothetical protein
MTALTRKRGDSFADSFTVIDAATGQPLNITGFTFLMTVDPDKSPTTAANNIFQIPGVVVDGPNGVVEFAPSTVQTDRVGNFYYDIQMTYTSGRKRTLVTDTYRLEQNITK